MNPTRRMLVLVLIVAAMILAFLGGTVTAMNGAAAGPLALAPAEWAAVQAANSLLLEDPVYSFYLPMAIRG